MLAISRHTITAISSASEPPSEANCGITQPVKRRPAAALVHNIAVYHITSSPTLLLVTQLLQAKRSSRPVSHTSAYGDRDRQP
jgi:hypothetical protein